MRWVLLALLALVMSGCTKIVYVPQEVYIPVECIESLPPKPKVEKDLVKSTIELQKAYLDMRLILSKCVRSKNETK